MSDEKLMCEPGSWVRGDPVGGTGQADRTREKERDFSEMCTRCRMRYGLHIGEDCQDRKGTFTQIPPAVVSPAPLDLEPIKAELACTRRGFQYRRFVRGEPNYRTAKDDIVLLIAEVERLRAAVSGSPDILGQEIT